MMKISKIIIRGFQQFEDFQLDLTHPETGKPLDRICLIGSNGTGKSTLLKLLRSRLQNIGVSGPRPVPTGFIGIRISTEAGVFFQFSGDSTTAYWSPEEYYSSEIEASKLWQDFLLDSSLRLNSGHFPHQVIHPPIPIPQLSGPEDLIIEEPSDESLTLGDDPPVSSLNQALALFGDFPLFHSISVSSSGEFWKLLIYLVKRRENQYREFLARPENRQKTIADLDNEFASQYPEILPELAAVWNRILAQCNLEFDWERAKIPVQLNDTLEAFIKVKSSGEPLQYNQLSSGIRNYIFKLGYLKALYFDRHIRRGFVFVDEPENCLYPDLLYGLIDEYCGIIQNSQFFVATHSPIIAAQFEPHERIHLVFDDRGCVTAKKGISPIDDDPNDLLYRDFQVSSIYGKRGLEKWNRFLELRQLIAQTDDLPQKHQFMEEYLNIGNAYNFGNCSTPYLLTDHENWLK
jgi:energy-coupling factor transporter ATP-binding protein EcfA2